MTKTVHHIRTTTDVDFEYIRGWLIDENKKTGEGFLCNISSIEKTHQDAELAAIFLESYPIGFATLLNSRDNILEIHPDHRNKGYGRLLSNWVEKCFFSRGMSVIEIECSPETSASFWKKMGYTLWDDQLSINSSILGQKELPRKFSLPNGAPTKFKISFYDQKRDWDISEPAFRVYEGTGSLSPDGLLYLPERAICYKSSIHHRCDCVARIEVNGSLIYEDKVKRAEGATLGILMDKGFEYYIDAIDMNKK